MTSTPSTRRLLDGVAVSIPHRSTEPAQTRHCRAPTEPAQTRHCRAPDSLVDFCTGPNSKKMDFDDFLAVPGCASGPHWTGEGDPPQIEEIISMSEEGFDLG